MVSGKSKKGTPFNYFLIGIILKIKLKGGTSFPDTLYNYTYQQNF